MNGLATTYIRFIALFCITFTALIWSPHVKKSYAENLNDTCHSTLWPHEQSDIKPDPSVQFGKLNNGFRYVIMKNSVPQNRVALYLNIQAGSVNETETERGYAHYLEHMLFNGTTNFPPGKLVEYFQSIGMRFGADTNAHTGYEETVYKIVLPKGNIEEIKKGLLVMSDYSRGALLLDSEVNRERGVIFAEKTARDSVSYRIRVEKNKNALKGTLLPERLPIGIEESLENVTGSGLRTFYDKWYRPENILLVIVGDMDPELVELEVKKTFKTLRGVGKYPACPDIGSIDNVGVQPFYFHEPAAGNVKVSIDSYWNKNKESDSLELRDLSIKEYIAKRILEKRLKKIEETVEGVYSNPHVYSGENLGRIGFTGLAATTSAENWQETLTILENNLRQLLTFGVSAREFEVAKQEIASYYESQVQTAANRKSTMLARQLVWNLNNNRVFQSPSQEEDYFNSIISSIDRKDINKVFNDLWSHQSRLIQVTGNILLEDENPGNMILSIFSEAQKNSISKFKEEEKKQFPYLDPESEPVEPINHEYLSSIDTERYTYKNGVIVNLKHTDFKKNEVEIVLHFGRGKREESVQGLSMLAESVVRASGSSKLTASEIREALAGSSVGFTFNIGELSFRLKGGALTKDIDPLVQGLFTLYRDPGIRKEIYVNKMSRFGQMYDSIKTEIRGAQVLQVDKFFAGGSKLYGMPTWEEFEKIDFQEVKEWLEYHFKNSVPEISVVGDFKKDDILHYINKYFGSLDTRKNGKKNDNKIQFPRIQFPQGESLKVEIPSKVDKSLVVFGWRSESHEDIQVVRKLNMLSAIFKEKVRLFVREKIGVAYSPSVYNFSSRVIQGHGAIYVKMVVDSKNVDVVKNAVEEITSEIIKNGVSDEEVERVRNPLMTYLRDRVRTNGYWLNSVLSRSTEFPAQLQWATTIFQGNNSITAEQMTDYARKYLQTSRLAVAIVKPSQKESQKKYSESYTE